MSARPCPCGSGQPSHWRYDARGIPLARTCGACHAVKMSRYRPDVLSDPSYPTNELVEEDV